MSGFHMRKHHTGEDVPAPGALLPRSSNLSPRAVLDQLQMEIRTVDDTNVAHLSRRYPHINSYGKYRFNVKAEFNRKSLVTPIASLKTGPFDFPSSQVYRISPTAARLPDQNHFGSLCKDGEKTSLSD
jgi:hypothetical protein